MLSTSSNLDHRKWRAVCVCVGGGGRTFLSYGQIFRFTHEEFNLVP